MTKYISCAETAKLIRKALKESFPDVKFSIRSSVYSGGATISIGWTDGPNSNQVEAVVGHFEASYVDGGIDYKGSIYHMMDGEQVRLGADHIHFNRDYSDAAVQRAIDSVYREFGGNFERDKISKPTIAQYRSGELWRIQLSGLHFNGMQSVQHEIGKVLCKRSDRLKVLQSQTAKKIFVTHDDNYSKTCGSGFSVLPTNL